MSRLLHNLARFHRSALPKHQCIRTLRRLLFENVESRQLLYSGEFDLQFGSGGIAHTDIDASTNWSHSAYDSVFQADGKLLATGDGGLARYLVDGNLDLQFGTAGRSSVPFDARSITLQSDGKILVAGNANSSVNSDLAVARFLANGTLDVSFDQDGVATVDFAQQVDYANDLAVQADGRIIVVGTSSEQVVIVRLLTNGALDSSFDGDGRKAFNATRADSAASVAISASGKILVLGQGFSTVSPVSFDRDLFVAQFLPNGVLDNSFDGDGIKTIAVGTTDYPANLVIGADGKILVAGSTTTSSVSQSLLSKLLANGQFDTSFDGDGIRTDPISSFGGNQVTDVTVQSDGKILVPASLTFSGSLMRYNANGSLDTTWDGDGIVYLSSIFPRSVSIASNGKILLAGAGQNRFAVVRLNVNGTTDTSFSSDGRTITSFGPSYDLGEDVIQQTDGKLLVVGQSEYSASVLRYLANGQLDTSFSGDGKFTFDFGPLVDTSTARSVALQADGKIVVAGTVVRVVGNSAFRSFGIARLNSNGTLDTTFSQDGVATLDLSGDANVRSVKIQANGRIVIAGTDSKSVVVARFMSNGTLDSSFGQNGTTITTYDTSVVSMGGMVALPDGRLLIASTLDQTTGTDDSQSILLVRYLTNGALDSTFGVDGALIDGSPLHRSATDIALQPDGKILVSGHTQITDPESLITRVHWSVSRFLTNGHRDPSFGVGGAVSVPTIGFDGIATSLALQTNGRIIVGGQGAHDPAAIRLNTDGSLDSSFAGDGRAPFDVAAGITTVNRVRVLNDGKAIVLGTYVDGLTYRTDSDLFLAKLRNDIEPAQSTVLSVVNGAILLADQWARDDALDIYREGATLVISDRTPDPRAKISAVGIAGAINQTPKRISIPWATIESTGNPLRFGMGLGDDSIQLLTQGETGDVVPYAGLSIGMDGGKDTLALIGNSTINNWYLNDANRVAMQLGNLGPVWISGLDKIVGGDSSDSFALQYQGSSVIPVINGGLGNDIFHLSRDADVKLSSDLLPQGSHRLTIDDVIDQSYLVESIERANIIGGPKDNVIDLSGANVSSVVRGGGGNDRIYGSRANDYLYGEEGHDLINGSDGIDQIFGETGNDILIGESGMDILDGGQGEDLVIGGFFAYLSYYASPVARDAILSVWRDTTQSYSQRVSLLQTTGVGPNQEYKLLPLVTAFDDQSVDTLNGGSDLDWFFAKGTGANSEIGLTTAGVRDRLTAEKLDLF